MAWHDDGSSESQYDWDLVLPDGRSGVLEVTSVQDEPLLKIDKQLARDGRLVRVPGLAFGWYAHLRPPAHVKTARAKVGAVLVDAEHHGRSEVGGPHYWGTGVEDVEQHQALLDRLDALDVWWAVRSDVLTPGTVSLERPGVAGFQMVGDPVNAWVSALLFDRSSDVDKLNEATDADERHLFVWVGGQPALVSYGFMETLRAGEPLPPGAPTLPAGITHLWLACDDWRGSRVLVADEDGWREVGHIGGVE